MVPQCVSDPDGWSWAQRFKSSPGRHSPNNFRCISRTGMNSRATGRRIDGPGKGFGSEERRRGYRAVTGTVA